MHIQTGDKLKGTKWLGHKQLEQLQLPLAQILQVSRAILEE